MFYCLSKRSAIDGPDLHFSIWLNGCAS
jgi:hypothetical protein